VVTGAGERCCLKGYDSVVFLVFEINEDGAVLKIEVVELVDQIPLTDTLG
jgi:hypothetical protein